VARPQIRIAGRSYDLVNYCVGSAHGVIGDCQRAISLMGDCAIYLRDDDGYGLGNTPEHTVTALTHALAEAKRLVRDTNKVRAHLYRNAAKTNPRRRRR